MATAAEIVAALDERDAAALAEAAPASASAVAPPAAYRQPGILQRWAAVAGDVPMPQPGQLSLTDSLRLQAADPELYAILSGQPLPPSLELLVQSGTFPAELPPAPSPEEQRAALVQQLTAGGTVNPWLPGSENVTAQVRLLQVAPEQAEALRLAAAPAVLALRQQQQAAEQQRQVEQQRQMVAQANANAQAQARRQFGLTTA